MICRTTIITPSTRYRDMTRSTREIFYIKDNDGRIVKPEDLATLIARSSNLPLPVSDEYSALMLRLYDRLCENLLECSEHAVQFHFKSFSICRRPNINAA